MTGSTFTITAVTPIHLLTDAEAANYLRTDATDAAMLQLLPLVDQFIERATGRDWTQDLTIHPTAKAAAGMLLTAWYDNPSQMGADTPLAFGLQAALSQLEAEALKYRKYQFEGLSGAGAIPLAGARMGDDVVSLTGVYGCSGDQSAKFEAEISDDGQIEQTSSEDLNDQLFVAILKSPQDDVTP